MYQAMEMFEFAMGKNASCEYLDLTFKQKLDNPIVCVQFLGPT